MNIKSIIILSLLTIYSCEGFAKSVSREAYRELVLGEIQNTFVKEYKVEMSYFGPVSKNVVVQPTPVSNVTPGPSPTLSPTPKYKPSPTPLPTPTPKKNNIVKKKKNKKKRGLLDWFDDEEEEDDDDLGKRKGKRTKKGLIQDDDFEPEPIKFDKKRTAKGIIEPSNKKTIRGNDWASKKMREMKNWETSKTKEIDQWFEDKKRILNDWAKAKKQFKKNLPGYKKNLVNYDQFQSSSDINTFSKDNTLINKAIGSNFTVIPEAFFSDVKDQGKRPTCAAFAATRALEIALAQNGTKEQLSEQYFYYASKPKCQQSPCSKRGSWAINAFEKSVNSSFPDIPLEKDCPYSKATKYGNETQLPLGNGCFQGKHKLNRYQKVKSLQSITNALEKGNPVVAAFKLSPNFYRNNGVVLSKDSKGVASGRAHAAGHAVLLVGYMKIPSSLGEGTICYLTANSWGTGWGKGGHACLSEKWVNEYRFPIPFLAVDSAR